MNEIYTSWSGPIIFIGYGSIAQGLLPLLLRHITCTPKQLFFIEPIGSKLEKINLPEATLLEFGLTPENYTSILDSIVSTTDKQTLIINLSVDVSSVAIIEYAQQRQALYIDTVVEPWKGYYNNEAIPVAERTNYFLREQLLALRNATPKGTTAVSCCGANPGMVSWLTKEAVLNIAQNLKIETTVPTTRQEWATLMQRVGIKGIHIAERDTQRASYTKEYDEFVNTWSVDGLISESEQPAELGWGTHELTLPNSAHTHTSGSNCALYLDTPGVQTKVLSWVPSGPQEAYLITHNEAISISEYFTAFDERGNVVYRPTCHYAYLPSPETITSLNERLVDPTQHTRERILPPESTIDGVDELGVLLYGHAKNAYWYGSTLSINETKLLAPQQNATGLQVTSAVLSGIVWMINHPHEGIVEVEELDYKFCLDLQRKYLGTVNGVYTDWYPTDNGENVSSHTRQWQFTDILVN